MVFAFDREYARLRALYPFESMEDRLPVPKPDPGPVVRSAATLQRLIELEEEIGDRAGGYRGFQLKRLHEDTVGLFINSPGFGVARMGNPTARSLEANLYREPVPAQPGSRFASIWSPGDQQRPADGDLTSLSRMLDESTLDFVNRWGFGYFKDRRHVVGFETHRFSQVPGPADRWQVQSLELVSLLLHDEPEVYVSDNLPKMNHLHHVPTRPLDRFERFGLDTLRQGEDLFVSQGEEGVRMLGAIRSLKQCVACHGCERGDLLGAFSYALESVEP
jgi:hypothetical protein